MQEHDVAGEPAKSECNMNPTLSGLSLLQQFGGCEPLIDTDSSFKLADKHCLPKSRCVDVAEYVNLML